MSAPRIMNRSAGALALCATLVGAAPAAAQLPASARGLGMGGAYLATARGYESLDANPAHLAITGAPRWSLALPQVAVSGTLAGARFEELPDLLDDAAGDARRDEILAGIPASGTEARYDLRAPLGALQVGPVAVGVTYTSLGEHSLSRDIVELLVTGYDESRTDYSVGNTVGTRATYYDVAAAYGRRFGGLSLGVTGHYLRGGTLVRAQMFEPRIDVEARDVSVNYLSVLSRGGSGYSLDVGAAYEAGSSLRIGAVLANAASRMQWSEELTYRDFRVSRSDFDELDLTDLATRYEESEKPLDPSAVPVRAFEAAQGLYDGAFLPSVAKLSAEWRPRGGTSLAGAYQTRLGEGYLAGRWETLAGLGIEQKLGFLAARAGYATDLGDATMLTGGLSLGPLHLGAAKLADGSYDGASREGWAVTLGIGVGVR